STRRHRAVEGHEVWPGLFEVEAHQVGIDHLDLRDLLPEERSALATVAFEAEFDILGSERIAVVEGDALTQLELVCQTILTLAPGFGQAGRHGVAGHRLDQRIVQGIEKQERRNRDGFGRVKVRGSDGEVNGRGELPLRLSGDVAYRRAADEQHGEADA